MDVAAWIKTERERMDWSQRALAKALGVSHGAVGQWETGTSRPSLDSVVAIARIFGASLAGIVGPGTDYPGELVEREDELMVIHSWRLLGVSHRAALLDMMRGAVAERTVATIPEAGQSRRRRRASGR